jgi:hypothetical protein
MKINQKLYAVSYKRQGDRVFWQTCRSTVSVSLFRAREEADRIARQLSWCQSPRVEEVQLLIRTIKRHTCDTSDLVGLARYTAQQERKPCLSCQTVADEKMER